ncbi:MAG: chemotaxis protein CheX [Pseudomonadota bacterium]
MGYVEDSICRITESIWRMVLGLETARRLESSRWKDESLYSAEVRIYGAWEGGMLLECSAAMAELAAGMMIGVPPESTAPEDVTDAVGELANIVAGNIKPLLPRPSSFQLPEAKVGPVKVDSDQLLAQLSFESRGFPFSLTLWGRGDVVGQTESQ